MFARSQQISSPLILPMLGSILATSVIASILILPPSRQRSICNSYYCGQRSISHRCCIHVAHRLVYLGA